MHPARTSDTDCIISELIAGLTFLFFCGCIVLICVGLGR